MNAKQEVDRIRRGGLVSPGARDEGRTHEDLDRRRSSVQAIEAGVLGTVAGRNRQF